MNIVAPWLVRLLEGNAGSRARHADSEVRKETCRVTMRDGMRLATDLYLPPGGPAPAVVMRTPYGRTGQAAAFVELARHGYLGVVQDCRGTGDSEPDHWDYYVYEREDSVDLVEWITEREWYSGFVAGCGGSYAAATQWCMAMHPAMSAIAPEVSGLGIVPTTRPRFHMFLNAYAKSSGRAHVEGSVGYEQLEREMLEETLAGGYYHAPLQLDLSDGLIRRFPVLTTLAPADARQWLWSTYSESDGAGRAELIRAALGIEAVTIADIEALPDLFGAEVSHDAHVLPGPRTPALLKGSRAPALVLTGWYDWFLDDALATWRFLKAEAPESVRDSSRLVITPAAHSMPGYHEGRDCHPELERTYRTAEILHLLVHWYGWVEEGSVEPWPEVVYYLMGANEWRAAPGWPPPEARPIALYFGDQGSLVPEPPAVAGQDHYTYDPADPTPSVGGSIVSYVYPVGSVDVSRVQARGDVLTYSSGVLDEPLDVVGAVRVTLYASSTAVDTDFSVRLSDVFPDGRALQILSATVRARYRDPTTEPEALEPDRVYRFDVDLAGTANRFAAGHRIRVDVSSADFPKFDRHANRVGEPGTPTPAVQQVMYGAAQPSCVHLSVLAARVRG